MKTKSAFALRELYADIKPPIKTPARAFEVFDCLIEFFTRDWRYKDTDVMALADVDNVAAYFYQIEQCFYTLKAAEKEISRINRHLRRLRKYNFRRYDDLDKIFNAYVSILTNCTSFAESQKVNHLARLADLRESQAKEFRERLKIARKRAGYTQKQCADYLGIVPKSYNQYEVGRAAPPLSTLYILSKMFGVSLNWLAGLE